MIDVIIIGKGPAGISCAIYLKRYNLNPLVIAKDYGTLSNNYLIENYYGIESINGRELIDKGVEQAKKLGIEIKEEEVLSIENYDNYEVITKNNTYKAKAIFLATGKTREKVFIKGFKEFEGKGISYCATCDGFFYRKKKIGIMGSGDYMLSELEVLKNFTNDIIIFSNEKIESEFEVVNDKIIEFYGEEKLQGVRTKEKEYELDAMFIALGSQSGFSFSKHLGIVLDEFDNIVVDENYMTNLEGIFAGGDVIGGLLQVAKAVSDGAIAATRIKKYLTNKSE